MNTPITTKFAALAFALFANTMLMGTAAYLFDLHVAQNLPVAAQQVVVQLKTVA